MLPVTKKKRAPKVAHCLSDSMSYEQYAEPLEMIEQNRTSVAWVAREAIKQMPRDEQPLLRVRRER